MEEIYAHTAVQKQGEMARYWRRSRLHKGKSPKWIIHAVQALKPICWYTVHTMQEVIYNLLDSSILAKGSQDLIHVTSLAHSEHNDKRQQLAVSFPTHFNRKVHHHLIILRATEIAFMPTIITQPMHTKWEYFEEMCTPYPFDNLHWRVRYHCPEFRYPRAYLH